MMAIPMAFQAISAAGSIFGGLMKGYGERQSAEAQAHALEQNAAYALLRGRQEKRQAEIEESQNDAQAERVEGAARAGYADQGIEMSGSALDVMADAEFQHQQGSETIKWKGNVAWWEAKQQAAMLLEQAHEAKKAGKISALASVLGGIGAAMGPMGSIARMKWGK